MLQYNIIYIESNGKYPTIQKCMYHSPEDSDLTFRRIVVYAQIQMICKTSSRE
jgi:hypothetical protein